MNLIQLKQERSLLDKQLDALILRLNQLPTGNCRDCQFYDRALCQKYQQPIPQDFLDQGCDDWQYDEYPLVLGDLTREQAIAQRQLRKQAGE